MAELKTQPTDESVDAFVDALESSQQREDSRTLIFLMEGSTGAKARMWGPSIIGFGSRNLTYAGGREAEWMVIGFSPRKAALVLYLADGFEDHGDVLQRLGKHSVGKGCLNIKRLPDVDLSVLAELVHASVKAVQQPGS